MLSRPFARLRSNGRRAFFFRRPDNRIAARRAAPDNEPMRVIILTLALFVILGVGATCRTPTVMAIDCDAIGPSEGDCAKRRHAAQ